MKIFIFIDILNMSPKASFIDIDVEKLLNISQEYWCVLNKDFSFHTLNESFERALPSSGKNLVFTELLKSSAEIKSLKTTIEKAQKRNNTQNFLAAFNLSGGVKDIVWRLSVDESKKLIYAVGTLLEEHPEHERNKLVEAFDQLNLSLGTEKFSESELTDIQRVLSERIDKFKLISQNVSDIVCLHEPKEARYLYVSPSLEEVTGYAPEEFVGKSPYDFFHPDMHKLLEEDHKRKQQGEGGEEEGPPPKMLFKMLSKDGGYIWLESHSKPIFDDSGNVLMILSTSRDVTERVDAEQEKEKYFEYYRILGNNIPNGAVFLIDKDYRFLIAEGQEFSKVKRTPDFYMNKTIFEVYDKDRLAYLKPYFETVIEKKQKVKFEYEHEGYDYIFLGTPYIDAQGDIVCGIFLTQNVTDSKQIERQLRGTIHELEFQKSALDASALVSIINPEGIITYVNKRFCNISGYSRRELIGNRSSIVSSDFHSEKFVKDMHNTMDKGKIWHGEIKNKNKNGAYFWVDLHIIPFKSEAGEIEKYVYIGFDISDRKRAEEDLKSRNFELDAFAYHTSHDLRAPLSSIIGLTTLINQERDINSIKHYNELVERSIKKLDDFIKSVLTHSQNKNLEFIIERIDFENHVQSALDEIAYHENYKKVKINKLIKCKGEYYSDPIRLGIVLKNLLINAVKYARMESGQPYINLHIECKGKEAIISIEDNGIGIKKEYLTKVFDMFYRANDRVEGSGLGLYIVKQTVDKLKGKIDIHSEHGQGTKIVITLPSLK